MAQAWFHCGRCGGLFQGEPGQACAECGDDPVIRESEMAFLQAKQSPLAALQEPSGGADVGGSGSRREKSKGRSKGLAVFVTLWVLFLGAIVGLVSVMRSNEEVSEVSTDSFVDLTERSQFVNAAYQDCYRKVAAFLRAGTAEARSQFVFDPLDTLGMMARVADRAPVLGDEDKPRSEFFELFEGPDGRAIQSVWVTPQKDRLEMVFLQDEDEEWRVDWENLVRYSEQPWSLFLSGNGPAVGEFRLLARQRASSTGGRGDVSRLMLLQPRPWDPGNVGLSSPEVQVDPGSELGQQLKAAFAMREANEGVFGTRLSEKDPKGMIRVRLVLRRSDEKDEHGEWGFTVEKLVACHWMHFDELGLPGED